MSFETNLSAAPYWDDYIEERDFYKVLFKPGVAVQTRELNQLQTILQKQIERFGDHVFKSGTIISGVNFFYNPLFPYIKITDLQEDGQPVALSTYRGLFVKNSANLQAQVLFYINGFEAKAPDLNTLYLSYINAGNTYDISAFSNNDVLDVFSKDSIIFDIDVTNGGTGFANSDVLHVVSAINVNVLTGSFSVGDVIQQSTTGAVVQVTAVANGANSTAKILSIKPRNIDLSNTSGTSTAWTIEVGYNVGNVSTSVSANVISLIGSGAVGSIITDSLGVVQNIVLSNNGTGYTTLPYAAIKPGSVSASVATLDLTPRSYLAKVRVASLANSVGFGYAFGITPGVIYQKGIFSRVDSQFAVVSKYDTTPNNTSVGFKSNESIVTYRSDSSLYDNAANTYNEAAPGADRLKVSPTLSVVNTDIAAANSEFLTLVEFENGEPAKENRNTVYNEIAKEFERRTTESAGDYVVNSFRSFTKEINGNTTHLSVVIDPGIAYISGKRVQLTAPITRAVAKASTTANSTNQTITANYGNYILVQQLGGYFDFKSGTTIDLYDTAKTLLTSLAGMGSITAAGNLIGTARIRSLVFDSGTEGTPNARYRAYLFDIVMSSGKSFRDVRSIFYNGTQKGVADLILEQDGTTSANVAVLYDTERTDIIFPVGAKAVKSVTDISYTYRTSRLDEAFNANGIISFALTGTDKFPYSDGNLSSTLKGDFLVVPTTNAYSANLTSTVLANTSTANLIGSATAFATDFEAGDYIGLWNGATVVPSLISSVVNNTLIILGANATFGNTAANYNQFYPANYPIPIIDRAARTINIHSSSTTAKITIGTLVASVNTNIYYNVKVATATPVTKSVVRDAYVKLYTGNNVTVSASGNNTTGPWSLGLPDVFRLKEVYLGNTTSDTVITKYFYINSYNDGDTIKNAELRLIPGANLALSNTSWLLVKFDTFSSAAEGLVTIDSFNGIINDAGGFSNSSSINLLEVPETLTSDNRYYDSRDCFDFRPLSANTSVRTTTVGSATINPANTQTISASEKYFPVPDSAITFDMEYYQPRIDRVSVDKNTEVYVSGGTPNVNKTQAPPPLDDAITVNRLYLPQYPTLATSISNTTYQVLDKKIGNESNIISGNQSRYTAVNIQNASDTRSAAKRYSMSDINKLERRINELEESVSLSLLERSIAELTIPSSTNPAKERFKNAFLVDSFFNHYVADTTNPEGSFYIDEQQGALFPLTFNYNVESVLDRSDATTSGAIVGARTLMLPFTEYTIVSQLSASVTPPPVQTYYVEDYTPPSPPQPVSVEPEAAVRDATGTVVRKEVYTGVVMYVIETDTGNQVGYVDIGTAKNWLSVHQDTLKADGTKAVSIDTSVKGKDVGGTVTSTYGEFTGWSATGAKYDSVVTINQKTVSSSTPVDIGQTPTQKAASDAWLATQGKKP